MNAGSRTSGRITYPSVAIRARISSAVTASFQNRPVVRGCDRHSRSAKAPDVAGGIVAAVHQQVDDAQIRCKGSMELRILRVAAVVLPVHADAVPRVGLSVEIGLRGWTADVIRGAETLQELEQALASPAG